MDDRRALEAIVQFLDSIGIAARDRDLGDATFLPGLDIDRGVLLIDRARLEWTGDLLHEAGHIAVTPAALRPQLCGAIEADPAVEHADEPVATAWAYAALTAIGLPAQLLFHAGGYHGKSAGLAFTYASGCYPGIAGLVATGMAIGPAEAAARGVKPYPAMLRWLRE
jgi:hypothetical protein